MDILKSIKIFACLFLVVSLVGYHEWDKHRAVEAAKTKVVQVYQQREKEAQEAANHVTEALQHSADIQRQKKDEQIQTINAKLAVALSELRNRPQRPTTLPENPSPSQACTARELYREDAEFLTREAARANSVIAERDYYYQQYEEVRKKINGTTE